MPSPADFRRAFQLSKGSTLGEKGMFTIVASHLGHEVKEQNESYDFPTTLEVECAAGTAARTRQLREAFGTQCKHSHIVYSAYGSPYECSYTLPATVKCLDDEGCRFEVSARGHAVRRRDIPTRAQEVAAGGGAAALEVSKEDQQRYLGGRYRVIKSRFGTSKCSMCHQTIDPGVQIAREEDGSKGGWAHAACLVRELNGQETTGDSSNQEEEQEAAAEAEANQQASTAARSQRASRAPAGKQGGEPAGAGSSGTRSKRRRNTAAAEE